VQPRPAPTFGQWGGGGQWIRQCIKLNNQTSLCARAGKRQADAAENQDSFLRTRKQSELHRIAPHHEAPVIRQTQARPRWSAGMDFELQLK